ncbi:unnamed protein product [Schistosoma margrebowiei]|uniref:Uncharacterized protein n=1 Tax=Schistosoma margrebowiei TaxID=48269 RepID=A0A183MHV2_9TREM|nr:unnamed protein product [Schistosoma margrebowiei]
MFSIAFFPDTDKLSELKITLNNRFQAFQDIPNEMETTMADNWKETIEALTSTCQVRKKYHHKEWMSIETLDKIQERKNEKTVINNSRTGREKAKGGIRTDK